VGLNLYCTSLLIYRAYRLYDTGCLIMLYCMNSQIKRKDNFQCHAVSIFNLGAVPI
jgi:hypothetical protein